MRLFIVGFRDYDFTREGAGGGSGCDSKYRPLQWLRGLYFRLQGCGVRPCPSTLNHAAKGFRVQAFGHRVSGWGFRVSGLGFGISGLGFRARSYKIGSLHMPTIQSAGYTACSSAYSGALQGLE